MTVAAAVLGRMAGVVVTARRGDVDGVVAIVTNGVPIACVVVLRIVRGCCGVVWLRALRAARSSKAVGEIFNIFEYVIMG